MSKNPTVPRPGEPITLVRTARGEARYRTVLDYALVGQPRQQRRATFGTLTEARAHVAAIKAKRDAGALPTRDRDSFNRLADEYLSDRASHVRPITHGTYVSALKPARDAFGDRPVGKLTVADIEALSRTMAERGVTARTTKMTLGRVQSVLDRALRQGAVMRNVADGVAALGKPSKPRKAMDLADYRKVESHARNDRLATAWLLTLHGLRRSEILGLRWCDIDLDGALPTLRIRGGRTGDSTLITPPKTKRGRRDLPLTTDLADSIRCWRIEIGEALGPAALQPNAFVFVTPAGEPIRPERFSDDWVRLCRSAGASRRVILYEARHTSVTLMRSRGVSDRIAAAWHGHDENVMRSTYDHANADRDGLVEAAEVIAALRFTNA